MNAHNVEYLLTALDSSKIKAHNENVKASCPLASWTHPLGVDNHPSFGVKIADSSVFNCFTCGEKGDLKHLVIRFSAVSKTRVRQDLLQFIFINDKAAVTALTKGPGLGSFYSESPDSAFERYQNWYEGVVDYLHSSGLSIMDSMFTHVSYAGLEVPITKWNEYEKYWSTARHFVREATDSLGRLDITLSDPAAEGEPWLLGLAGDMDETSLLGLNILKEFNAQNDPQSEKEIQ